MKENKIDSQDIQKTIERIKSGKKPDVDASKLAGSDADMAEKLERTVQRAEKQERNTSK
jgi:hypothetical protein